MPVTVFGSLNQDLVTHTVKFPGPGETVQGVSFERHLGGKGFNGAVAVAKLKAPTDRFTVRLLGCLGDDDAVANDFIAYLKANNVSTSLLKKVKNTATGTASIVVQDNYAGENRIIVVPGANAHLHPTPAELERCFNASNHPDLNTSIDNPALPSHVHSHATKPPNNEPPAKTADLNPHPPSSIHSHGSLTSLNNAANAPAAAGASTANLAQANSSSNANLNNGLVSKNGSIIHSWSASGMNLSNMNNTNGNSNSNNRVSSNQNLSQSSPLNSSSTMFYNQQHAAPNTVHESSSNGSFIHSHKTNPVLSSAITNSYADHRSNANLAELPSELNAHASVPRMDTLTYPSPKPSALDLQNAAITLASKVPVPSNSSASLRKASNLNLTAQQRLTNVSFSLGGSSAHSSSASLTPCQSYLQMVNKSRGECRRASQADVQADDLAHFVVLQNEIPNPTAIIHTLASSYPNVRIFYNPSPLPARKAGYNQDFLSALHESHYLVVNEHELAGLVKNFHPNPDREPLTLLSNTSNFEPHSDYADLVNLNIKLMTKLRTLLTKPSLIVTLGPAGILYSEEGKFNYAYILAEEVDSDDIVDTTGAGDTFLGAVVTSVYRNETLESAVKFAARASAETIKSRGAAESMPYWKDVEKRGWLL